MQIFNLDSGGQVKELTLPLRDEHGQEIIVYGGTLTVNEDRTGTLTVTDVNIASYNGETLPGEWISSMDVYAAGTTPTTGAQVVYKLAEPIAYPLTASEVSAILTTLKGDNNVWCDAGDISELKYYTQDVLQSMSYQGDRALELRRRALIANSPRLQTSSAEQGIVSFHSDVRAKAKQYTIELEPQQDLHGYDSPWPAGGRANIWDEEWEIGGVNTATGADTGLTDRIRTKNYVPVSPDTTYRYVGPTIIKIGYVQYNINKDYISGSAWSPGDTLTTNENAHYLRWYVLPAYGTTYNHDIAINYPSTVTTYSPYSNICPISGWNGAEIFNEAVYDAEANPAVTITFPNGQTVYGGTLTVNEDRTGTLTVTDVNIASYNGETLPGEWISSMDVYAAGTTPTTGAQVVYKLAEPIAYPLTASEVSGILSVLHGDNNIWTDTNSGISVKYWSHKNYDE